MVYQLSLAISLFCCTIFCASLFAKGNAFLHCVKYLYFCDMFGKDMEINWNEMAAIEVMMIQRDNSDNLFLFPCILIEVLFVHASHNILKQQIKMKVHWFYKGHILISNTIRCETCKLFMNFVKLKGVLLFIPFCSHYVI